MMQEKNQTHKTDPILMFEERTFSNSVTFYRVKEDTRYDRRRGVSLEILSEIFEGGHDN